MRRLSRLAVDLRPLHESRELRLLLVGWVVSGLGTQAALVALPYQVYVKTGSELLVGLLGAVELVPLMAMALLGGAIAGSLLLAAALFAVAGGADSVSAVCRATITQSMTPDRLRGRMSSVHSLVVTSGPRLGDVRAGAVAAVGGGPHLGRLRRSRLHRRGDPDRAALPVARALRRQRVAGR